MLLPKEEGRCFLQGQVEVLEVQPEHRAPAQATSGPIQVG